MRKAGFFAALTLISVLSTVLIAQDSQDQIKRARAAMFDKNYQDALKRFEMVLEKEPGNIEAQLGKLEAYSGLGQKSEITTYSQKRAKGSTVENHVFSAQVHLMNKDIGNAEKELKLALDQESTHYMALYMMGLIRTAKGDKNTAFKYFSASIKAQSSFPEPYYYIGDLYFTTGKTDNAVKYWKKYIELVPPTGQRHQYVNNKLRSLGGG